MDLRRDHVDTGLTSIIAPQLPPKAVGTIGRLMLGAATGLAVVVLSWNASQLGEHWWAATAAILLAAIVAGALPLARRLLPRPGAVPVTVLLWLVAAYGCVPETDHMVGVGILVSVIAILEFVADEFLPFGWLLGIVAAVLWAALYGATARQSALVGALFGVWPVLLGPLVAPFSKLHRSPRWVRWTVSAIGAAAAVIVARTGALATTIGPALRDVATWGSASAAMGVVLGLAMSRHQPINATPASRRRRTRFGGRPFPRM